MAVTPLIIQSAMRNKIKEGRVLEKKRLTRTRWRKGMIQAYERRLIEKKFILHNHQLTARCRLTWCSHQWSPILIRNAKVIYD